MQHSDLRLSWPDRATIRQFRKRAPKTHRAEFGRRLTELMRIEELQSNDPVSLGHAVFAACVISCVEQWQKAGLDRKNAKESVREAVLSHGRRTKAIAIKLTSWLARDPYESFKTHTKRETPKAYGPTFEFGFEESPSQFTSIVHKCGYRTILAKHNAEDLIDLFCAWDMAWIEALPSSISFDRPKTLAKGGKSCRFEFERAADES